MTPRPPASARVPRWRVDASRAVSPRACLGGAGGPPGTQVGLLGPGCAAVPAPGGRAGQKIPAQYTLLTHTVPQRYPDPLGVVLYLVLSIPRRDEYMVMEGAPRSGRAGLGR